MVKFRLYFDKDKETKWLNEWSEKGWAMSGFFAGFYRFAECEKGKYIYQIDFVDKFLGISSEYREFMQDIGAEIVMQWGFWVILRKPASEGAFELYTDVDSSIEHYSKIRRMFYAATLIELICLLIELFVGVNGVYWGYVFALLLGAILITFINVLTGLNNTIEELKERKTGIASEKRRKGLSALLPCGLLLNSCALIIEESVPHYLKLTLQILAILLMLTGVYLTCRSRKSS